MNFHRNSARCALWFCYSHNSISREPTWRKRNGTHSFFSWEMFFFIHRLLHGVAHFIPCDHEPAPSTLDWRCCAQCSQARTHSWWWWYLIRIYNADVRCVANLSHVIRRMNSRFHFNLLSFARAAYELSMSLSLFSMSLSLGLECIQRELNNLSR